MKVLENNTREEQISIWWKTSTPPLDLQEPPQQPPLSKSLGAESEQLHSEKCWGLVLV